MGSIICIGKKLSAQPPRPTGGPTTSQSTQCLDVGSNVKEIGTILVCRLHVGHGGGGGGLGVQIQGMHGIGSTQCFLLLRSTQAWISDDHWKPGRQHGHVNGSLPDGIAQFTLTMVAHVLKKAVLTGLLI